MESRHIDSTTPRTVVKMCGPAKEVFRLFRLFCEERKGMRVMEVK